MELETPTKATPEFLVWALEHSCPVRGFQDGSDPERTERQLRAARTVSEARRDGRVFERFCVDPPNGFREDEALAIYGGPAAVEQVCGECPANALAAAEARALAGCYGIVALPEDPSAFYEAIEDAIKRAYPNSDWSPLCAVTTPRWHGLWIRSPLKAEQLLVRYRVLKAAAIENDALRECVQQMLTGMNTALDADCRFHVALYPRGHVKGAEWRLVAHCPRCKAAWGRVGSRHCEVCGSDGPPAPDRKRKARGLRPYFPLERVLGKECAADFLVRYQAFRARQQPPDRA